jgi:hypothetical protein
MTTAAEWIDQLQLTRHPEGGWYRETYRSDESIPREALPPRFSGARVFSTAIYFLLQDNEFSALHRIKQDEVWHFHDGGTLIISVIDESGESTARRLGRDFKNGDSPQLVVRGGCWFGAALAEPSGFALMSCTVAPGFDFADFEMPSRHDLLKMFPQHCDLIERLTQ